MTHNKRSALHLLCWAACLLLTALPVAVGAQTPDPSGFARATGPREFHFPADFGPHSDYQTEWWYYTGNIDAPDGRHFGYQLTFFRRALSPPSMTAPRASAWATNQAYMAHFALTDVGAGRFHAFGRFARGALGLAGATGAPYRVWLQDWSVEEAGQQSVRLRAAEDGLSLDLTLVDAKGAVLQGDQGYSRKGPEAGNASYYFSQTRLDTTGSLATPDGTFAVHGASWMDHEFSTSALSGDQVGWDWFALQLGDRTEATFFRMRRADGSADPYSTGTFVAADGRVRPLWREDVTVTAGGEWSSPRSGARYPSGWTLRAPSLGLELKIEPLLPDQELDLSYRYWEGAVRIRGTRAGAPVDGYGYVELTGYAGSMQGQF